MKIIERKPYKGMSLTVEFHFEVKQREKALEFKLPKEMKDKGYTLLDECFQRIRSQGKAIFSPKPMIETYYRIAQLL